MKHSFYVASSATVGRAAGVSALFLALGCAAAPARAGIASPYVIDFFPEGQQINNTVMLGFFGPGKAPNAGVGYEITDVRLVIEFTTAGGFNAADLVLGLVAPAGSNSIFLTGANFGWSGGGTFSDDLHFSDLNGAIGPGLWTFDLYGDNEFLQYSGTFSDDTRWEVYLSPIPAPGGIALLSAAAMMGPSRRRRLDRCSSRCVH